MQQTTALHMNRKTQKKLDWAQEEALQQAKKGRKAPALAKRFRARQEAAEAGVAYRDR